MDVLKLDPSEIPNLSDERLAELARQMLEARDVDRRENALFYYEPASPAAFEVHKSNAQMTSIGGGNGSSKTECMIVEMIMLATGIIPNSLRNLPGVREKQRGPVSCRLVVESLTTTLVPIILPKMQWFKWTGVDQPGGKRGHWGWIPRWCLIGGSWDKSYSAKDRLLRVLYRDPDEPTKILGESVIQFMSKDQDSTDFASGDFHFVGHDEPPTLAIWRENQARTMRVAGRMFLAMTWPDDPSIAVDWLFDEVYEPAQPGVGKDPQKDWFNLFTTDNRYLDQTAVAAQSAAWTEETRRVRIFGQPIRFSNRVHPLFTDQTMTWCFECGKPVVPHDGMCSCGSRDLEPFCHVRDMVATSKWPTVYVLDPHPRKPHMMIWVQIDPQDDWWQVAEASVEGDPSDVAREVELVEMELGLRVAKRLTDPNMARSPAGARRGVTWQDEFMSAGLCLDLADDSEVGRARINEYLQVDPHTRTPRFHVSSRCTQTIQQFKRYVWDDYKKTLERDQKQKAKQKNDDFPTMVKYLANEAPTYRMLESGPALLRRIGTAARRGAHAR